MTAADGQTLRWGILGCGRAGLAHWRQLTAAGVDVVVGRDPDPSRSLGPGVRTASGLRDVLESRLDGVSICTPPESHTALAIHCLDAGLAVLSEKPGVMDRQELRRLEAAWGRAPFDVVRQQRYEIPARFVRTALRSIPGGARRIIAEVRLGRPRTPTELAVHFAWHYLDLARFWLEGTGSVDATVEGSGLVVRAAFPGGRTFELAMRTGESSLGTRIGIDTVAGRFELLNGAVTCPPELTPTAHKANSLHLQGQELHPFALDFGPGLAAQYRCFLDRVRRGTPGPRDLKPTAAMHGALIELLRTWEGHEQSANA
jgi:predicted dehydrogenase